jgi:hypothetical protein
MARQGKAGQGDIRIVTIGEQAMSYQDPYWRAINAFWRAMRREGYADYQINQPNHSESEVLSDDEVILWVLGSPTAHWRSWKRPQIKWIGWAEWSLTEGGKEHFLTPDEIDELNAELAALDEDEGLNDIGGWECIQDDLCLELWMEDTPLGVRFVCFNKNTGELLAPSELAAA